MEKVTDDEGRHNLNLIRNNCQRLMELINQLLDLSAGIPQDAYGVAKEELVSMVRGMTMAFESLAELHIELIVNAPNEKFMYMSNVVNLKWSSQICCLMPSNLHQKVVKLRLS